MLPRKIFSKKVLVNFIYDTYILRSALPSKPLLMDNPVRNFIVQVVDSAYT